MRTRLWDLTLCGLCAVVASTARAQAPDAGVATASAQQAPTPDAGAEVAFDLVAALAEGTPMTADQAAARAQEVAPSIERAEALTLAAEAGVQRARALLWPRLELTARAAHVDGFPDSQIGGNPDPQALAAAQALAAQVDDPASRTLWQQSLQQQSQGILFKIPRNQVALTARLNWPVSDAFFSIYPTLDAARANVRASQAEREARNARVRLSAREAFFQLAHARGNLAVAQRALLQTQAQQALIDAAVKAGIRPPSEAASAASRVALADQALAGAETGVDVADASLRSLLQQADGPVYAVSEPLVSDGPAPAPLVELLDKARAQRPEVRALRAAVDARHSQTKSEKAAGYPHLGVYVGGDYSMPNRYQLPPRQEFLPSWEVGATLSYAPNDTVNAQRKVAESNAQIAALEAELGELLRSLDLEVRRSRATLAHSQRNIEAARVAVVAAEAAYTRRMAELKAGEVVLADVIGAEQELNIARLRELDAGIEQQQARARLAYALGE